MISSVRENMDLHDLLHMAGIFRQLLKKIIETVLITVTILNQQLHFFI